VVDGTRLESGRALTGTGGSNPPASSISSGETFERVVFPREGEVVEGEEGN
jgi:hypothetical protein